MKRHIIAIASLFWAGSFASIAMINQTTRTVDTPQPKSAAICNDPRLADLHDRWKSSAKDLGLAGVAVIAVCGDRVIFADAFGRAEADSSREVTLDSPFYIASATKPLVATCVMMLVDAHLIDLDKPVKSYLPRFELADKAATESISVRDLLTHAKGIDSTAITFCEAYTGLMTDDRYFELLAQVTPQGKWRYSNVHYTIAGRLIRAVSGKPWQEFMADGLFQPLGMSHTSTRSSVLYRDPEAAFPLVWDHDILRKCPVQKTDRTMHAAGGIGMSARDMGAWLRLNLNLGEVSGKRILGKEAMQEFLTTQVAYDDDDRFPPGFQREGHALGWTCGKYKGVSLRQHHGDFPGARCYMVLFPERDLGVACLTNTGGASGPFSAIACYDVADRLLGLAGEDPLPNLVQKTTSERKASNGDGASPVPAGWPQTQAPSRASESYCGRYRSADWGDVLVSVKENVTTLTMGDLNGTLLAADSPETFRCNFEGLGRTKGRVETVNGRVTRLWIVVPGAGEVEFRRE